MTAQLTIERCHELARTDGSSSVGRHRGRRWARSHSVGADARGSRPIAQFRAVAVTGMLLLVGCAGGSGVADPNVQTARTEASPPTSTELAPTTTIDQVRLADLERIDQVASSCPQLAEPMVEHYDRTGQVLECAEFTALVDAVAAELAAQENARKQREFEAAVKAEMRREAEAIELKQREFEAAVKAEMRAQAAVQRQRDYEVAVARAIRDQTAEAHRQGDALVRRQCSGYGWYYYEIDPVRVWLSHCERTYSSNSGGGDLDCEDIGYEHEIDPDDDPYNLDGDGDGIACEGW